MCPLIGKTVLIRRVLDTTSEGQEQLAKRVAAGEFTSLEEVTRAAEKLIEEKVKPVIDSGDWGDKMLLGSAEWIPALIDVAEGRDHWHRIFRSDIGRRAAATQPAVREADAR